MGSELLVTTTGATFDSVTDVVAHLDRLELLWTRFSPDSDLSRINTAEGEPVHVSEETLILFTTMAEASVMTDGRYSPTILPTLVANGYGASRHDRLRTTNLPVSAVSGGRVEDVLIDTVRNTVTAPKGMAFDPGGIGKGLACDLAVAMLLAGGAAGALVSIGGDLSMAGEPTDPDGWAIAIDYPRLDDRCDGAGPEGFEVCNLGVLAVSGGGVATSSTRSRRWTDDGVDRHHLIDPATLAQSDTDLASVTVIASTGWAAEAHATAALLAGSAGVVAYLDRHDLTGIAVTRTDMILRTSDLMWTELRVPAGVR